MGQFLAVIDRPGFCANYQASMAMMNRSDDELAETTRRLRTSLDAQRFTFTLKQPVLSTPSTATAAASTASTFLLPILLPSSSARPGNSNSSSIETQPLKLQELSGKPDARSSNSAAALLPQEIANADLAIAGAFKTSWSVG